METLKKILMQFAKETKGLKKATSVEIDKEIGAVFFKVGNSEIEVNQVKLMLWMVQLNIRNNSNHAFMREKCGYRRIFNGYGNGYNHYTYIWSDGKKSERRVAQ
jgi:hypothetical protein